MVLLKGKQEETFEEEFKEAVLIIAQLQNALSQYQALSKVLVERLGGNVTITDAELKDSATDGTVLAVGMEEETQTLNFIIREAEPKNDEIEPNRGDDSNKEVQKDS